MAEKRSIFRDVLFLAGLQTQKPTVKDGYQTVAENKTTSKSAAELPPNADSIQSTKIQASPEISVVKACDEYSPRSFFPLPDNVLSGRTHVSPLFVDNHHHHNNNNQTPSYFISPFWSYCNNRYQHLLQQYAAASAKNEKVVVGGECDFSTLLNAEQPFSDVQQRKSSNNDKSVAVDERNPVETGSSSEQQQQAAKLTEGWKFSVAEALLSPKSVVPKANKTLKQKSDAGRTNGADNCRSNQLKKVLSPASNKSDKEQQQSHYQYKSVPPRFQCLDCNRSYSTFSGLSKHKQFHCVLQQKRQFGCKYCDKQYSSLGAMKMHIRTHTLPCKCEICGKAFSRPWLLQGHMRTHTGERPFSCHNCGRAFADRSNLRAHLQTHSDVRKYRCKVCQKTFSRLSLLNKHESNASCNSI